MTPGPPDDELVRLTRAETQRTTEANQDEDVRAILNLNHNIGENDGRMLADVAGLLRLMDALVQAKVSAAEFVDLFTRTWLRFDEIYSLFPPHLDPALDEVQKLYEDAQLFSARPPAPEDRPYLLNSEQLQERTRVVYANLLNAWTTCLRQAC